MKHLYNNISKPWAVSKTVTAMAVRLWGISSVGRTQEWVKEAAGGNDFDRSTCLRAGKWTLQALFPNAMTSWVQLPLPGPGKFWG